MMLSLLLIFLVLKSKHDINQMRDSHAAAEQAMMEQIEGLKQIHADEIADEVTKDANIVAQGVESGAKATEKAVTSAAKSTGKAINKGWHSVFG